MTTHLETPARPLEKAFYALLAILLVATLCYAPFMYADAQRELKREWDENGCQMYDDKKIADVPAKCQSHFVDHYAPQERREQ